MSNNKQGALGFGVITIFTVLLVLCLTVFAVLTLSSARADLRLSQINADTIAASYAADIEAHRIYNDFAKSGAAALDRDIPVSQTQYLHLHLVREGDRTIILAWNTVPICDAPADGELGLWDGIFSE